MAKKKIGDLIAEWMNEYQPEVYELHRSEFVKEVDTWYLRVYVDKKTDGKYDYMSSDDCEIVSRYLSECLDKEDPIKQNYYLEVSSPGMDRPLINDSDYNRFKGQLIEISLYKALDKKKNFEGTLLGKEGNTVSISVDDKELKLQLDDIAKINLAVVF